jgi:uncharacterized protein (UPF0210 family)
MKEGINRRQFSELLALGIALPASPFLQAAEAPVFRIRTITASVILDRHMDLKLLESAAGFLQKARHTFEAEGYEVQTLRLATQAVADYLPNWWSDQALAKLQKLDDIASEHGMLLSIGPVLTSDKVPADFPAWASELINSTKSTSFSVNIASVSEGLHQQTIDAAAGAIAHISRSTAGGEGNFRFAATAFCPAGTPFFPAAWYDTPMTFSIGLESPRLLLQGLQGRQTGRDQSYTRDALRSHMNRALAPVEQLAINVGKDAGRHYLGMDTSPAPGLDASIGEVIETLGGAHFGSASTLSTCALLTDVLKGLAIKSCGYSGLLLPVLEDKVLALRAAQGRFGINELLLYSSVCGTGLDVVPLAGDIPIERLAAIIGDVAALATKYRKPLSARLFPVPGKIPGAAVSFQNPYLTDSVILDG